MKLTTTQKIKILGAFRKDLVNARDEYGCLDALRYEDEDGIKYFLSVEHYEELLQFALLIRSERFPESDTLHVLMIDTLRGYLENAVHTAAGH